MVRTNRVFPAFFLQICQRLHVSYKSPLPRNLTNCLPSAVKQALRPLAENVRQNNVPRNLTLFIEPLDLFSFLLIGTHSSRQMAFYINSPHIFGSCGHPELVFRLHQYRKHVFLSLPGDQRLTLNLFLFYHRYPLARPFILFQNFFLKTLGSRSPQLIDYLHWNKNTVLHLHLQRLDLKRRIPHLPKLSFHSCPVYRLLLCSLRRTSFYTYRK